MMTLNILPLTSVHRACQCHLMPEPSGCGVFGALIGQAGDVFREICHRISRHDETYSAF